MNLTKLNAEKKLERKWYLFDAEKQILGRLAAKITELLIGKHQGNFDPSRDYGDTVVVINASKLKLSRKKLTDKKYYHHSGYPGGLKTKTLKEILEKNPTQILKSAVYGMLPKNRLQKPRMKRLKIYSETEHLHQAQELLKIDLEKK